MKKSSNLSVFDYCQIVFYWAFAVVVLVGCIAQIVRSAQIDGFQSWQIAVGVLSILIVLLAVVATKEIIEEAQY